MFALISPAYAQLSDRTGLKQNFVIETGGYKFPVDVTSNFNVERTEFSKEEKRLSFFLTSGLENNLAEIQIPKNLINGNLTFYLDDVEIFPTVKLSEKISFITLEFVGVGKHKLDVIGTTYLPEFSTFATLILFSSLALVLFSRKITKIRIN